jgi:hypothetical protein
MPEIAEQECHDLGRGRKRAFIFGRYERDEHGEWSVPLPRIAPCGYGDGSCRIREHNIRERLTGPAHHLVVIYCTVHDCYFTVYPVGYVPYGRKRLISEEKDEEETVFTAAFEAADGYERWSEIGSDGRRWWSTQWRQIRRAGELLGLGGDANRGEKVAMHLGIALHIHAEARGRFDDQSFRQRGRAVVDTVRAVLAAGVGRLWRLLRAGYAAGFLGRSFHAAADHRLVAVTAF